MRSHVGALLAQRASASSAPSVGTRQAQNLYGREPLVLDPQTMMSMGVESFTEERTGSARAVGIYVLVVDVTCVKSLWSSYGVVSPE